MNEQKRFAWVIVSALLQGILLAMYAVARYEFVSYMPITLIVLIPFVFWLTQEHWGRRLNNFIIGLSIVLLIFYVYRLWSLYTPDGIFYLENSQRSDLIRISMAVFLLIPFFQCRIVSWSWRMPYADIFFQFCRNLFLLFQAAIVIAVFWGMLITAGLLFDIVGLEIVPFVILNPFVSVPLTSLIIAISISVAISHPGIDSLGRWILSVLAWLLPFFSFMSVIFMACLPFSGLKMLWNTGQASTLMLLLQFGTIILANAAWLDGSKNTFTNKYVNFAAQIALLCLPVYFGMCIYSVGLRIEQYGLSVDRIQAMFLVVVTGVWGMGYAGAVLLRVWPSSIGIVNVSSVVIMAVIVAAMNSPILDPYKLAALNQSERLVTGEISPENFDYIYARFNLGRYGISMLQKLEHDENLNRPKILKGINSAMSVAPKEYREYLENGVPPVLKRESIMAGANTYPEEKVLSVEFSRYLMEHWRENLDVLKNAVKPGDLAFIFTKLEAKNSNIIALTENSGIVFRVSGDVFERAGKISGTFELANIISTDIEILEPAFKNLKIGNETFQVTPTL